MNLILRISQVKAFLDVKLEIFPGKSAQFVITSSRNEADLLFLRYSLQFKAALWNCVDLYVYVPGINKVHALSSCPVLFVLFVSLDHFKKTRYFK